MLNQLYQNMVWTQRANFFEMPTDCPQRDERMGWTGDAQIYVRAATFNADIAAFYTKWLRDLNDDQWDYGAYPAYAPAPARPPERAPRRRLDGCRRHLPVDDLAGLRRHPRDHRALARR